MAATVSTSAQRAPAAKPYKESPFRQVIPGWQYPDAVAKKDARYYELYNDAIAGLVRSPAKPDDYGPAILTASQRMYDDEMSRRESINTRSGAVLSTGGILGALFVAAGQLGLMQQKGSYQAAAWFVLAAFLIALAYIGFSITMAIAVQASLRGNVTDPIDLVVSFSERNSNEYSLRLAKKNLSYTVKNYKVNNELMFRLHSAQRCLRNGIFAIIIAGMLSPLALHTAAASKTGSLSYYHRQRVCGVLDEGHSATPLDELCGLDIDRGQIASGIDGPVLVVDPARRPRNIWDEVYFRADRGH